ncbi:MAG: flagellar biosynthesis protein FlhF-like protein [Pseudomonadota bacterium]
MRMKMFAAATLDAAKAQVFAEMGDGAIILSEREIDGRFEVRAAADNLAAPGGDAPMFLRRPEENTPKLPSMDPLRQRLRDMLLWHGAPRRFADRVAEAGIADRSAEPNEALATGLEDLLAFEPIPTTPDRNLLLVGPPGHGRTATAAKLVRRAAIAGADLAPLVADFDFTAGGAQLAAYLEQERDRILIAADPDQLFNVLARQTIDSPRLVIDMPAIAPFDHEDIARLADLVAAIDAEPVLVLSAEGHAEDLADAATAFREAGVRRAILTKLDIVRRRGGVVAALQSSGTALSHLSASPFIGGGLVPAAANRLADLLVEESPGHAVLKGAA